MIYFMILLNSADLYSACAPTKCLPIWCCCGDRLCNNDDVNSLNFSLINWISPSVMTVVTPHTSFAYPLFAHRNNTKPGLTPKISLITYAGCERFCIGTFPFLYIFLKKSLFLSTNGGNRFIWMKLLSFWPNNKRATSQKMYWPAPWSSLNRVLSWLI